jgi:hypothetical protein
MLLTQICEIGQDLILLRARETMLRRISNVLAQCEDFFVRRVVFDYENPIFQGQ